MISCFEEYFVTYNIKWMSPINIQLITSSLLPSFFSKTITMPNCFAKITTLSDDIVFQNIVIIQIIFFKVFKCPLANRFITPRWVREPHSHDFLHHESHHPHLHHHQLYYSHQPFLLLPHVFIPAPHTHTPAITLDFQSGERIFLHDWKTILNVQQDSIALPRCC